MGCVCARARVGVLVCMCARAAGGSGVGGLRYESADIPTGQRVDTAKCRALHMPVAATARGQTSDATRAGGGTAAGGAAADGAAAGGAAVWGVCVGGVVRHSRSRSLLYYYYY